MIPIRFIITRGLALACFGMFVGCASGPQTSVQTSQPTLSANKTVLVGDDPQIVASGLMPGEIVRIHQLRKLPRWQRSATGTPEQVTNIMHGWADFQVNKLGRVDVSAQAPIRGSYRDADGLGLSWSAQVSDHESLKEIGTPGLYALPDEKNSMFLRKKYSFLKTGLIL